MAFQRDESILKQARDYEKENSKKIPKGQKPGFHFSVPTGWSNDPNGLSYYDGKYHLFYQYNPYKPGFGNMHWGHCSTTDFITWDYLPAALAPDIPSDKNGVFSGSGIESEGKHVLMYTGLHFLFNDPDDEQKLKNNSKDFSVFLDLLKTGRVVARQVQNIAIGDGLNYEKIPENPVISSEMLPADSDPADFRDPKIWKDNEDNRFYAVIGGKDTDGDGQILLYSSADLKAWQYEGVLYKNNHEYGGMWECPDFFTLNGNYVLLGSPIDMKGDGYTFSNHSGSVGLIGTYDKENCRFCREHIQMLDYGMDFYAPQTMLSVDGRRIMIAWMEQIRNCLVPESYLWNGMMTLPRELRIENGKLYAEPVRELRNYYANPVVYKDITVDGDMELEGIKGRYLDMTIETEAGAYNEFAVEVAADETYKTVIRYAKNESLLTIDRAYTGHEKDNTRNAATYVASRNGKIQIRIILDNCALEVYVNHGEQVMSALIFTPEKADGIRFTSVGKVVFSISKYDLVYRK